MTPSSDTKTAPVSLRIRRCAFGGGLDRRDVDLAHRHHSLECALSAVAALAGQLEETARCDLPAKAPFVPAPAAGALFAAVLRDRVPVAIGFSLILRQDHE